MPRFSWRATLSASRLVLISRSKYLDSKSYTEHLRFEVSLSSLSRLLVHTVKKSGRRMFPYKRRGITSTVRTPLPCPERRCLPLQKTQRNAAKSTHSGPYGSVPSHFCRPQCGTASILSLRQNCKTGPHERLRFLLVLTDTGIW